MTIIVGIEAPEGVLLGADSLCSSTMGAVVIAEPKVFRVGPYGFGFTNSGRLGDLLRHHLKLPDPPRTGLHKHLVTKVIPLVRECLKEGGYAKVDAGVESGGGFLVAVHGHLFEVQGEYDVGRTIHGYQACGSGVYAALGALSATAGMKDVRSRARLALEAAERHNPFCRRPWRFLWVFKKGR